MNNIEYEVHVDPEFRELVYPLSTRAYQALKARLLQENENIKINVWNHQVLDSQIEFEICAQNGLPFTIEKKHFRRRKDAISWICEQQLQRNDLTPQMRRYLIGMLYETRKPPSERGRIPNGQSSGNSKPKRSKLLERLAEQNNVTVYSVARYGGFARAINRIRKQTPKLARMILSGNYGITHEKTVQLSRQQKGDLLIFQTRLTNGQDAELKESISANIVSINGRPAPSVKDDPVFDPDAEINGLALTIPSWCSSMERIRRTIDPAIVSENAKNRLRTGLLLLTNEVQRVEEFVS